MLKEKYRIFANSNQKGAHVMEVGE